MQDKIYSVVGLTIVCLVGLGIMGFVGSNVMDLTNNRSSLGTDITYNAQNGSYTEGGELRQNVQAIAERMSGLSQYQILQADSAGKMEAVTLRNLTGDWALPSFVERGSVDTITVSTTLTAAQVCDNGAIVVTTVEGIPTITLPATSTLFADCLTTNGDSLSFPIINGSSVTSTLIAAGTGGTLLFSSSSTISVSDGALLQIVRDAATTYKALLINAL